MIHSHSKPEIRIWIFNHWIRGITDQLDYLCMSFCQQGYTVSISKNPLLTGLNILIENFDSTTFPVIERFVRRYGKRLAVVMTEHVDFIGGKFSFHGSSLNNPSQYMHPVVKRARLLHLLLAKNYIRYLIRLGDLPDLVGFDEMMREVPILTIPFPRIHTVDRTSRGSVPTDYDFVFAGGMTEYRKETIEKLTRKFSVHVIPTPLSRRRRDAAYASAKVILNVPQERNWPWISTMRVLAAWRCGCPIISMGNKLRGELAQFCRNILDVEHEGEILRALLDNPQKIFQDQFREYSQYAMSPNSPEFPTIAFRTWQLTELDFL